MPQIDTPFLAQQTRPLILDGGMGTALQQAGLPLHQAPERWNISHPEIVKQTHQAYIKAGATIILTNSFGGNRVRLAASNMADQVQAINLKAARLAREAAGDKVVVWGSLGPTGLPAERLAETNLRAIFYEQAIALAEGGVDGLHIETMYYLEEAVAAIEAVRQVASLPITVTICFDTALTTMLPDEAARALASYPEVVAFGVNCGRSLEENLTAIIAMHEAVPEAMLIAKPNAGLPRLVEDNSQAVYDVSPEMMAEYALKFIQYHVKIIGGCCGTTPAHIRAIQERLYYPQEGYYE